MKKLFLILASSLLFFYSFTQVFAQTEADLEQQITDLQSKISTLQDQAQTLSGQITYYDSQIALSALKISQTELLITSISSKINTLETSLQTRSKLLQQQIVSGYKDGPVEPLQILFSSHNVGQIISGFKYTQTIQESNRKFMYDTQVVQSNYSDQKLLLQASQTKLLAQKVNLTQLRAERSALLDQTQNSETKYQALLVSARANLAALRRFVTSQGGASILTNQTYCNDWGCYYNQRDAQWGLMALGTSNSSVAEFGCLVSSTAMIASHYKANLTPADIASEPTAFFRDLLWLDINVKGNHITRTRMSPTLANIDSELAAGRPVIVGLFSGPDHFIVIKSGSKGNYVMNDPFMPEGHDVNFTDRYSLSNISDVEKVSVN